MDWIVSKKPSVFGRMIQRQTAFVIFCKFLGKRHKNFRLSLSYDILISGDTSFIIVFMCTKN